MISLIRHCLTLLDRDGRRRLGILALLVFVNTVLEVLSIGMIVPFIALLNRPEIVETSAIAQKIIRLTGAGSVNDLLLFTGVTLLFLVLFKNCYLYFVTRAQYRFAFGEAARISGKLFQRYLMAPYITHLSRNSSDLTTTANYTVDQVFASGVVSILIMATEASAVIGIVALLFVAEPWPTLSLTVTLTICTMILVKLTHGRLIALGEDGLTMSLTRMRILSQSLTAIKELQIFGRETYFRQVFQRIRDRQAANQAEVATLSNAPRMVIEGLVVGGLMMVVVAILLNGQPHADIIRLLGLFAMAAFRIMPGVNRVFIGFNALKNAKPLIDAVIDDLNHPTLDPRPLPPGPEPIVFRNELALQNVSFSYPNAPKATLQNISLAMKRGDSTGFVGSSGAGKSTLIDLLMGILVPSAGVITVDGRDIASDPRGWQSLVGYVPQAITLIDDTMRNNVAFGIDPKDIDDARIWQVLKMARLENLCRAMPDGLNTMLGDRGVRLSGGERQRVGIARALYHDPEVLVFDEATSSLDNESEFEITRAIESLRGDKTLIIIAHRLSTVQGCDRLVLMQGGCIVDTGNFQALLQRSADFREMVRLAEIGGEPQVTTPPALH